MNLFMLPVYSRTSGFFLSEIELSMKGGNHE